MNLKRFGSLLLTLVMIFSLSACGGSSDSSEEDNSNSEFANEGEGSGSIQGSVVDATGNPLSNATVKIANTSHTATTNIAGMFEIEGVSASERVVINVSELGYLNNTKTVSLANGQTVYATITLLQAGATNTMNASVGGNVTDTTTGAGLSISAGTLAMVIKTVDSKGKTVLTKAPLIGQVDVSVANLAPTSDAFPGFEAAASDGSGEVTQLESFGAISCVVEQDGVAVDAEFTGIASVPIPAAYLLDAPDTIDFWNLNEATGLWEKTGVGGKTDCDGTPCYKGEVTHCSSWNADVEIDRTCVTGVVLDASNNPVSGAEVVCAGSTYSGQDSAITDTNGRFECFVKYDPAGEEFFAYARGASGNGPSVGPLDSPSVQLVSPNCEDIGSLLYDGVAQIDFSEMTQLTMILAGWEDETLNLDLHVTGPDGVHVYYANPGSLVEEPYLLLRNDAGCSPAVDMCLPGSFEEVRGYYTLAPGEYNVYVHRRDGLALPDYTTENIIVMALVMNLTGEVSEPYTYSSSVASEIVYTTTSAGANNAWHALRMNVDTDGTVTLTQVDSYLDM